MNILRIEGERRGDEVFVQVTVMWPSTTSVKAAVLEAISEFSALDTSRNHVAEPLPTAPVAQAPVAVGTATRRPRTRSQDSTEPAAEAKGEETAAQPRRRRATAEPAKATPVDVTDADLSRAASHTAAEIAKLGLDGPGVVKAVLADYKVEHTGDIPAEKREKFLQELREEIELAEKEVLVAKAG